MKLRYKIAVQMIIALMAVLFLRHAWDIDSKAQDFLFNISVELLGTVLIFLLLQLLLPIGEERELLT